MRYDLPRPSMICTSSGSLAHSFIKVYGRPWWKLFRKEIRLKCMRCPEERFSR